MTTATKPRAGKNHARLLPPTADVAKIAGKDFVIMPLSDFEEWQEDQLLAAVVAQRLESGEKIVSMADGDSLDELLAFHRDHRLDGLTLQELIAEGRR